VVRVVWNRAAEERLLGTVTGPVGSVLRRAGEQVQQEAKRLCPVSPAGSGDNPPGHLRSSIALSMGKDAGGLHADIGTDVEYALYVETGTRPHVIESHGDYPLRSKSTGQVFGRRVNHPGTTAQPYLRPALGAIRGNA
jgi:hypothetical protein